MAKVKTLDMTAVKEGRMFNKKHQPEGDYRGQIVKVEDAKKKDDASKKMWLFTIKVKTGVYPFYCGFGEAELWKIKNLWIAAGVSVPAKRVQMDPNKVVGKDIGVTLQDTEWDGKTQSEIGATFPVAELEGLEEPEDADDEEPKSKKKDKGKKAKPAAEEPKTKGKKKKSKKAVDDDELESLDVDEV